MQIILTGDEAVNAQEIISLRCKEEPLGADLLDEYGVFLSIKGRKKPLRILSRQSYTEAHDYIAEFYQRISSGISVDLSELYLDLTIKQECTR